MPTTLRRSSSPRGPLWLALVGLPVVGAVTTLAVAAYLTSWDVATEDPGMVLFTLLFTGWALVPFAAAVVVGVSVHRYWRGGSPVAIAGGVLLVAFTVWTSWSVLTSESSTAVLGLLFAPFVQAAVVGVTMAGAVGVGRWRRRHSRIA